ncbi:hypothetical protein Holit_02660 [Hollandina sp. SP2]
MRRIPAELRVSQQPCRRSYNNLIEYLTPAYVYGSLQPCEAFPIHPSGMKVALQPKGV